MTDDLLYPPINGYHKKIIYSAMQEYAAQEVAKAETGYISVQELRELFAKRASRVLEELNQGACQLMTLTDFKVAIADMRWRIGDKSNDQLRSDLAAANARIAELENELEVAKKIKLPSEEWVSQITTPFRSGAELYRDEIKRLNQID